MGAEPNRSRQVLVAVVVWLVFVGVTGFATLVWMRECSTGTIVLGVSGLAVTMLVVFVRLAFTRRATSNRLTPLVLAAWAGFALAYYVCNLPDAATREYLRSLGDPSRPRDGQTNTTGGR